MKHLTPNKLRICLVGADLPEEQGYRFRDGIEAEHRKADIGSWKQAQQKVRVFGERERNPVASSARRGFPYSETRICQSAQRPYSRTRCTSHGACFTGSISSRFTSQKRWPERAFIFREGNASAGDVGYWSDKRKGAGASPPGVGASRALSSSGCPHPQ